MHTRRIVVIISLATVVGFVLAAPQALRVARSDTEITTSAQPPARPVRPLPPTRPEVKTTTSDSPRPPHRPTGSPHSPQEALYEQMLAQYIDRGWDPNVIGQPGGFQISSWSNDVWAGYFVLDSHTGEVVRARKWLIDLIPEEEYETSCEAEFFIDAEE